MNELADSTIDRIDQLIAIHGDNVHMATHGGGYLYSEVRLALEVARESMFDDSPKSSRHMRAIRNLVAHMLHVHGVETEEEDSDGLALARMYLRCFDGASGPVSDLAKEIVEAHEATGEGAHAN